MDNQHRQISGYRELTPEDIALMNSIKGDEKAFGQYLDKMKNDERYNQRSLALAKTKFDEAFMWLIRAVARPNGE